MAPLGSQSQGVDDANTVVDSKALHGAQVTIEVSSLNAYSPVIYEISFFLYCDEKSSLNSIMQCPECL